MRDFSSIQLTELFLLNRLLSTSDPKCFFDIHETIKSEDFLIPEHQEIFNAIETVTVKEQQDIDIALIRNKIQKKTTVALLKKILELSMPPQKNTNVIDYANEILNAAKLRNTRKVLNNSLSLIDNSECPFDEILELVDKGILNIHDRSKSSNISVGSFALEFLAKMRAQKEGEITGISSTLPSLDRLIYSMAGSQMYVIAGRPSSGKTELILQMLIEAGRSGHRGLFFSLEMAKEELIKRTLSYLTEIPLSKIISANISKGDWTILDKCVSNIINLPLEIDDSSGITLSELMARARRYKIYHPDLAIIAVDYIQLLNTKGVSREHVVAEISRGMKTMAKNLKVPVLAVAQLSRQNEYREDKRPRLSDLRESGCIPGYFYIRMSNGSIIKLQELYEKKSKFLGKFLLAYDYEHSSIAPDRIINILFSGYKPIYSFVPKGQEEDKIVLQTTENHMIQAEVRSAQTGNVTYGGWLTTKLLYEQQKDGNQISIAGYNRQQNTVTWIPVIINNDEKDGVTPVFDITTEKYHSFLANDIIVHNSIEQDADVVMFIHRPGYYDKKLDSRETEIIVAKHRNGPIGTVTVVNDFPIQRITEV